MPTQATSTIFVIGDTGAQGMPIVRALAADNKYAGSGGYFSGLDCIVEDQL
jgi:hypothetical protein